MAVKAPRLAMHVVLLMVSGGGCEPGLELTRGPGCWEHWVQAYHSAELGFCALNINQEMRASRPRTAACVGMPFGHIDGWCWVGGTACLRGPGTRF